MSDFTRPNPIDDEIDAAMKAAAAPAQAKQEVSFKRQWDPDLDAELEAAMAGFDAESLYPGNAGARTRAADRAHVPKGGVGQESRQGLQKGKVVAVRGKSVFVDLGAKSEGVIPIEQFGETPIPNIGDMIEFHVDHFDTAEGLLILSLKGAAVEASWENLEAAGLIVEAKVTKVNKAGLLGRRGRRHPRCGFLPDAATADRHQPRRGRLDLRRPQVQGDGHRGQPAREEPRRLPPRHHRAGACRGPREDLEGTGRGPGPPRRRPLGEGLRRLRRPRRRRRPAPHRRHELDPAQGCRRPRQARRQGRGQDPQDRPHDSRRLRSRASASSN